MQDSLCSISSKFSVAYRLLRTDSFEHVLRTDRTENISNKQFKVFFVRSFGNNARLGIVASKKTLPSAADRNRAKRIIREAFRHHNLKFCKLDLVVMVRRDYSSMIDMRVDNLERLFSQVENRCADW